MFFSARRSVGSSLDLLILSPGGLKLVPGLVVRDRLPSTVSGESSVSVGVRTVLSFPCGTDGAKRGCSRTEEVARRRDEG